ncbi:MAG: PAS domain S-box protein, partial [Planctomycetes bacterium]|nr:PAS domain S-box protein [Planctomycetota bacterium]
SLAIPLINSDAKMFGVLNLYSSEPRFFTKKTERLFITFANHALSAIENRQLIEGLEEKVKERTKEIEETHSELKKLFNAVEQSGEAVVVTDAYGIIEYVNPAFCTISGYSREEALGRNPKILNSGKNPPGLFRDMWNTILSGKIWRGTVINRKKTGDLYHEEMTVAPVIDSYGEITNFIAVKNDVTDKLMAQEELRKKNIELDEARMQAESANRAKSDFLSNMSHEMRTPLGAIIGFYEMMTEGFAGEINAQQSEYLGNVINA